MFAFRFYYHDAPPLSQETAFIAEAVKSHIFLKETVEKMNRNLSGKFYYQLFKNQKGWKRQ